MRRRIEVDVTIKGTSTMARGTAIRLLAGWREITHPGAETGMAEDLAGELGSLGMVLRQPLGLNFQSAWMLVSQASGGKIERQVA
jgi:hypothetical protein